MNYPNAAKAYALEHIPLNMKTATYSWNDEANKNKIIRDVVCW